MQLVDLLGHAAHGNAALASQLRALPPFPAAAARHCLLSGPERSGKTSLLFHVALAAARRGEDVLLLCRRKKLEQAPPLLPHGVTTTDPAWQRVRIKYLESGLELLRFASLLHAAPAGPPDLLLVDDLHALADLPAHDRHRPRDMALCRVLAALHEAVVGASAERRVCWAGQGRGAASCGSSRARKSASPRALPQNVASDIKGSPCQLVATEACHADGPRLLYILQRWLPLVLHIRPAGQAHVVAPLNPRPDIPQACRAQLRFSLRHDALALEALNPGAHW